MAKWEVTEMDEEGRETYWDRGRDHVEARWDGDGFPPRGSRDWTAIWLRGPRTVMGEATGLTKSQAYKQAAAFRQAAGAGGLSGCTCTRR